ncbi:Na+/H+ antiporter NhaC family protein [Thalassoroseus pseudoceratinae]|uniref:Na+/H+ antiporter NhaC family protein n=1 Tax=Thalassoroseus pseudoceratinae TaxID=2713176 RepID=UPI00141F4D30|nr:Na+/H+ antiporter NhaC family protein [Thalassoroseus pseudoceratinae]
MECLHTWLASLVSGIVVCLGSIIHAAEPVRFEIDAPPVQLVGVPIHSVTFTAMTETGDVDVTYNGSPEITGVRWVQRGKSSPLPPFENGQLTLSTDLTLKQSLHLDGETITIRTTPNSPAVSVHVPRRYGWMSLLPPLLAIGLAVWWREVVSAIAVAVLVGMTLLTTPTWLGPLRAVDTLLVGTLTDSLHVEIVLFTLLLGAMIGLMSATGGTRALVQKLMQRTTRREHGQMLTWILGVVIFFDDYANTLLVGSTMRPVADRLRFSREKLAFLVDATAAPIAGLAVISTWVGFEVAQIGAGLESVGESADTAYTVFLATIPYRFYPILLLVFVGIVAKTGRDFGPMRTVDQVAWRDGDGLPQISDLANNERFQLRHAIVPLFVLLASVGGGMAIEPDNSTRVLLLASFAAVVAGLLTAVISRTLDLEASVAAAIKGMRSMLAAVVVLVLAWAIAEVCSENQLNTAGYLVSQIGDEFAAEWLPMVIFLLAGAVSFSTGSSFATMGLLMPLAIAVQWQLLSGDAAAVTTEDPLLLATIGAVLAGAIFGDHCSPISDTTVLSSAAAGCDHLAHVRTQMPYALTVGVVTLIFGYVPIAFGVSPLLTLPIGSVVLWLIVRFTGQTPDSDGTLGKNTQNTET